MPFDPASFSSIMLVLAGFGAAFLVVLWVSLIVWTIRDIRSRTRDVFVIILATLVSVVLFLPGVVIYLMVRPRHTLEEEFTHTLEEEALLQTIEDNPLCPGCGRRIHLDWIACPTCHTHLKKNCASCGHLMDLAWELCPFCGELVEELQPEGDFIPLAGSVDGVGADHNP
ncbi:MAG: zinc ribbon domain-containing protein [Anaerolineaceae bacterium]|nr:zinc ribbon domain-containing protein [Anaerolineaceae bacterium]